MTFTLPMPPTDNHLYATYRGRRVKSKEARDYARMVSLKCNARPLVGGVSVKIDVYFARRGADLHGRFKCLMDSLNGIAWLDDKQVQEFSAMRFYDKANPRVVMEVLPVTV